MEKAPRTPVPPPASQFSSPVAAASSAACRSPQWPVYTHPPDGLLSFVHNPQTPPFPPMPHPSNFHPPRQGQSSMENFHFVDIPPQFGSFSMPPPPPPTKVIPSSSQPASAKVAPSSRGSLKKKKLVVNLEDDSDPARTAQRLAWTSDEETRLAAAWLENSNDPIDGNNKKNGKYWDDIAVDYNSNTPNDRKRDAQQLKQHFHKVKTKINAFHGEYCVVSQVYTSGYSEDQLQEKALEKYEKNHKKTFQHLLMWRKLKENGKWLALVARLNGEKNKNPPTRIDLTSHILDVDDEKRHLLGRNKAKAERDGKRKTPEVVSELGDKLDKFIEVQAASMSSEKLQTARLAKETKMLDVYQNLLLAGISLMDENAKAMRARALVNMESMLFPQGGSGPGGEEAS